MRRAVLWDSSAILALLDASDADHARAAAIAREIASERRPCFAFDRHFVERGRFRVLGLG
jgi:hypothetical protein